MDDNKDERLAKLKEMMGLGSTGDLAVNKMVSDAPIYKALGVMQLSPEQEAQAQAPAVQKELLNQQNLMGAAGAVGSIGKMGQTAANALREASELGGSSIEKFLKMKQGLERSGGAAQRLGATAENVAAKADAIAQGHGGNLTDLSFLQQILNKKRP